MTLARHTGILRWILVGAVAVTGIAASVTVGDLLRRDAVDAWLKRAERDATDATAAVDAWIKEAEFQIRGVGGALDSDRRTSPDAFTDIADRISEWSDDVILDAVGFARHVPRRNRAALERDLGASPTIADKPDTVAPDAFESFVVTLASRPDGLLRIGSDLITLPATAEAVFSAYRNQQGQAVSGPTIIGADGKLFTLVALRAANGEHGGAAVGLLDLSGLIAGALNLHAPDGLTLRLFERETESSATTVRSALIGDEAPPTGTIKTFPLRLSVGQARWEFLWDVGPTFRGGPRVGLARVLQIGGSLFSVAVTLLLGLSVTLNRRISDRVTRTVAELRESERGLTEALEASPIGVSITAPEGLQLWVNSHMARLLGVTADDLIDSSPGDFFVDQADRQTLIERMRKEGSVRDFEALLERPDGTRLWVMINVQQIRFRGETARISLVHDISQMRAAHDEALRSTNLLKLTLESMDQGLIVRDAQDNILLFNEQISALLDVPREMYERNPTSAEMLAYHKAANHFADVDSETLRQVDEWMAKKTAGAPVDRLVYERRGPSDRWILVTHLPMPDGLEARTFMDITERKNAERNATEKTRFLELTLENMDQGIVVADAEGRTVLFNKRFAELVKVPPEFLETQPTIDESVEYQKTHGGFAETDAEIEALADAWEKDPDVQTPLVYERRQPGGAWLLVASRKLPGGGFVRTMLDITERRQAEQAQRDILEAIPVPLVLSRLGSVEILYANPVAHALYGLSTGDNDRERITSLYIDQDARREMFRRLEEDGKVDEYEFELMTTEGDPIWVLGYARTLEYHGASAALVVTQPITERKRLERTVAERSELLQTVLDHMGHGLLVFDRERHLIVSNKRFSEMYDLNHGDLRPGISQEDLTRLTIDRHWTSDEKEKEARLKLALSWSRDTMPSRQELSRPDGRVFVRDFHSLPGGGAVITHTDFTEVKRAQAEAEQALENLKTAQASLVQSEKLASLGQLVAGIAHEIKNPLNFVNNFSSVSHALLAELKEVLRDASSGASPEIRDEIDDIVDNLSTNLKKITEHGGRADNIIKTMLLHARGSDRREELDVNALVTEAINLAYHGERATNPGFNATIERALDPSAGNAWLVQQEISRVLINLLNNAFHAVSERARSSGDESYQPTITVAARGSDEAIEIRIRDNGTGMTDEVKARLFTPFFTTKKGTEGTGLGLSLSYDIVVRQHHGTIQADSQVNDHTEFLITIPRERPSAPPFATEADTV